MMRSRSLPVVELINQNLMVLLVEAPFQAGGCREVVEPDLSFTLDNV